MPSPIHAIVGSDDAAVATHARELAGRIGPGGDFGTETIDGEASTADIAADRIDATIQALLTFPFFGGGKLVWLKGATFLADDITGRSEAVLGALERLSATLQSGLPDGIVFLLSASPIDKRRSFYKTLQKLGSVAVHDAIDTSKSGWEDEAISIVHEAARERGLTLAGDSAPLIAMRTGGDRRLILSELEKLDLYTGPDRRQITPGDVQLLVPMSHVGVIFELGNALSERDAPRAIDLLERLLFHGEKPVGLLLASIIPTVRNLLLAKSLIETHRLGRVANPFGFGKTLERLPAEATAHLPRKKDGGINAFGLGFAAAQAHRFTERELRAALHACLDANLKLITSAIEPRIVLTQLIVRIASPASNLAAAAA
jgi:DNA polymerase-3 subunit delta